MTYSIKSVTGFRRFQYCYSTTRYGAQQGCLHDVSAAITKSSPQSLRPPVSQLPLPCHHSIKSDSRKLDVCHAEMTILATRAAYTRSIPPPVLWRVLLHRETALGHQCNAFSTCPPRKGGSPHQTKKHKGSSSDPRIQDVGRAIKDDYASIRERYGMCLLVMQGTNLMIRVSYTQKPNSPRSWSPRLRRVSVGREPSPWRPILARNHAGNARKWHRSHHYLCPSIRQH